MKWHLTKEEHSDDKQEHEKCTSSTFRNMQIKTTMKNKPTEIKNSDDTECWWGNGRSESFIHGWWEYIKMEPLRKRVWCLLIKINTNLSYNTELCAWAFTLEK